MAYIVQIGVLHILSSFIVFCATENWLGPGKWSISNTMHCDHPDKYPYKFDLMRKRINRTHEGITAHFVFPDGLDDLIGFRAVVCKFVDGGCKPYRVMTDKSFHDLCDKFIAENLKNIFMLADIDPPSFPVKAGEYNMREYIINYDELPEKAAYGSFRAELYLTKNMMDVSCHILLVEFKKEGE